MVTYSTFLIRDPADQSDLQNTTLSSEYRFLDVPLLLYFRLSFTYIFAITLFSKHQYLILKQEDAYTAAD